MRRGPRRQAQQSGASVDTRPRQTVPMRRVQRYLSVPSGSAAAREVASTRLRAAAEKAPLRAVQQAFLQAASAAGAHEDARERGSTERVHVSGMRQSRLQQDLPHGAPAQAHRRETARLRPLRQRLHLTELPERASSYAHRRETAPMHSL